MSGHSRGDQRAYRTAEEEAEWRGRDPIPRYARTLRAAGLLTRESDAALKADARAAIREAVAFARRGAEPDPAGLLRGVYA
jgi:pyruvate dehydrogenase E1 component alpha subunit